MERDQRAGDAREALAARREHSKGDGNFPKRIRPPRDAGERPEDRTVTTRDSTGRVGNPAGSRLAARSDWSTVGVGETGTAVTEVQAKRNAATTTIARI